MSTVTSPGVLDSTGQSIATAISSMSATSVGNLAALTTTDKSSLVGAINELKSGLTNAAKTVYRDFHRIEPGGSYGFNLTLEENHAYIVAICSGNNGSWGYCGIMLKGWVSDAAVLSDIYKGTYITVTVDNTDSIEVSNTETTYTASCEIMVIDLGRGQQPS